MILQKVNLAVLLALIASVNGLIVQDPASLVNKIRSEMGHPPLAIDPHVQKAAQNYAKVVVNELLGPFNSHIYSHLNGQGQIPKARIEGHRPENLLNVQENIIITPISDSNLLAENVKKTPKQLENINGDFTHFGTAVEQTTCEKLKRSNIMDAEKICTGYHDGDTVYFIVQDFAKIKPGGDPPGKLNIMNLFGGGNGGNDSKKPTLPAKNEDVKPQTAPINPVISGPQQATPVQPDQARATIPQVQVHSTGPSTGPVPTEQPSPQVQSKPESTATPLAVLPTGDKSSPTQAYPPPTEKALPKVEPSKSMTNVDTAKTNIGSITKIPIHQKNLVDGNLRKRIKVPLGTKAIGIHFYNYAP